MRRLGLPEGARAEVWARWKRGESLQAIGQAVDRSKRAIYKLLVRQGGMPPAARRRAPRVLRLDEREEISRGLAAGLTGHAIARRLQRAPSTICREVARHGGRHGYRAAVADGQAWHAARRPKRCRLAQSVRLRRYVEAHLQRRWSPEQIAGALRRAYPHDPAMRISHEAIYRSLFVQTRGVLRKSLQQQLRRPRAMRRSRHAGRGGPTHGHIPQLVSIRERPAAVEDRAVPGHWEGDLLIGTVDSQIATLVERQSRYVLLVRVPSRDSATVVRALARQVHTLPTGLMRSLTWDRGRELSAHQHFTVATDVAVYFCDPRSPWQRGSNENTNGLLRQYFPKGTDLSLVSQTQLNRVARELNQRPRKTLGFATPADKLAAIVASTG